MKQKIGVFFIFVIIFCSFTSAMIGISPGLYEVDFQPNLKQTFRFEVIGDTNMKFVVVPEGNLADYVKIEPKSLSKPGFISVTLSLPEKIDTPGQNILYINAKQQFYGKGGISLLGNIKGIIRVKVPYPEEYATVSLSIKNTNVGQPSPFKIMVNNLGKNAISAKISLNIYNSNNKSVTSIPLGVKNIESLKSENIESQLDTSDLAPGFYRAEAVVKYGDKFARDNQNLRLGELYINITKHSNDFIRNQINKFDVEIESLWNDPIQNVYAEVSILNYTINFKTPSANLEGFEKTTLSSHFDTTGILEDEFKAKIKIVYKDKITEKIVNLRFKKETNYYLIIGVIVLSLMILIVFYLIFWRRRKHEKSKNSKSRRKK